MTKQATARRVRPNPDPGRRLRPLAVIDLRKGWTIAGTAAGRAPGHAGRLLRGRR